MVSAMMRSILALKLTYDLGRVIVVTGKGLEDVCDDLAGHDGGEVMYGLVRDDWLSPPPSATLNG